MRPSQIPKNHRMPQWRGRVVSCLLCRLPELMLLFWFLDHEQTSRVAGDSEESHLTMFVAGAIREQQILIMKWMNYVQGIQSTYQIN